MILRPAIWGVLLAAAPLFAQPAPSSGSPWVDPRVDAKTGEMLWFQLTEDREEVGKRMGKPVQVVETGNGFFSWQYQIGIDTEDYSHYFVFRKADGKLVSVTRQYDPEQKVADLFPAAQSETFYFESTGTPKYPITVRRLSGGRLLIGMGLSERRQPISQILLIRESDLEFFNPWLRTQLSQKSQSRQP